MYVCAFMYVCMYVCMYACMHACMYDMHVHAHKYAQTYHKNTYAGMLGSPIAPVAIVSLTPVYHIRYGGEPDPAFVHIVTKEGESFVDTGLNARHAREGQVGTACMWRACGWGVVYE